MAAVLSEPLMSESYEWIPPEYIFLRTLHECYERLIIHTYFLQKKLYETTANNFLKQ